MKLLTPAERLIVAADFKTPDGVNNPLSYIFDQVSYLARALKDTGVYLKVNSALRLCGYTLISQIHGHGLKVFADLKLFDIGETLATDGAFLRYYRPELLTVTAPAGIEAMKRLKAELPDTEILGVGALTTLTNDDCQTIFSFSTLEAVVRFSLLSRDAGLDGLIMSGKEAFEIADEFGLFISINTPAIRPEWAIVKGDDQNPDRIMTPAKAIKAGADRIVVGRPITQAANPREAVLRTIEEIASALA